MEPTELAATEVAAGETETSYAEELAGDFADVSGIDWASLRFWKSVEPPAKLYKAETHAGEEIVLVEPEKTEDNKMFEYNCHGFTFGTLGAPGGPFVLSPRHVLTILKESNGWIKVPFDAPPDTDYLGSSFVQLLRQPAKGPPQLPPLEEADVVTWKRWDGASHGWLYEHSARIVRPDNATPTARFVNILVASKHGIQDLRHAVRLTDVHNDYNVHSPRVVEVWRRKT